MFHREVYVKITRRQLRKLIKESIRKKLFEGRLSKSDKDYIRNQIELELGEEFELIARQAKSIEEYDRLEQMFMRNVEEESNKRIAAAESELPEDVPYRTKVKIEREPWESSWDSLDRQDIVPSGPSSLSRPNYEEMATIDVTPDPDGDNSYLNPASDRPITQREMSRRDLLKSMMAGTAAAASMGMFDDFIGATDLPGDQVDMSDPVQVIDQWFNDRFADGSFDSWYDHIGSPDFFEMWGDSPQAIIEYLLDFSPEEWNESLVEYLESVDLNDPFVSPELFPEDYDFLGHIRSKLEEYYTNEKIDQLFRQGGGKK